MGWAKNEIRREDQWVCRARLLYWYYKRKIGSSCCLARTIAASFFGLSSKIMVVKAIKFDNFVEVPLSTSRKALRHITSQVYVHG